MTCCPRLRLTVPGHLLLPRLTRCRMPALVCTGDDLAGPPTPCGSETLAGGDGITTTWHSLGTDAGEVEIEYNMQVVPDRLDCYYAGVLVATTGGPVSGGGSLFWSYPATPGLRRCKVVITGGVSTAWSYTVHCPVPGP